MEVVHVRPAIGIDPRDQRHGRREFIEVLPVDADPRRAGHRRNVDRVVGRPAGGEQRDHRVDDHALVDLVAHAGEEGPPAYIWSALDVLKVERIDHGVQAVHDAALMARLAKDRTPLTVCPLSNQKLCVFPDLKNHNIGQLLDAGLCVTINSDDPAYFGGYMNDNFVQTFEATGLNAQQAYVLASNSFEASFATEQQKNQWLHALKQTFQKFSEQD